MAHVEATSAGVTHQAPWYVAVGDYVNRECLIAAYNPDTKELRLYAV